MSNLDRLNELLDAETAYDRLLNIYHHVEDQEGCDIFARAFEEYDYELFKSYVVPKVWDEDDWDCLVGDMLDDIQLEIEEQMAVIRCEVRDDLNIALRTVEEMREAIVRSLPPGQADPPDQADDDIVMVEQETA
jgi:hypothetical protein